MNHILLNKVDELILENKETEKLLNRTCHIISASGSYSLCWIGLINEKTGCIEPLPHCGTSSKYLKQINFGVSQKMFETQTPSGSLFNIAKFYVNNNIWNDPIWNQPTLHKWRARAFPPDFNSIAIFPLIQNLKTIGAVYLYSDKKDFFTHDELMLLEILAMNLSFALDKIESRKSKRMPESVVIKNNQFPAKQNNKINNSEEKSIDIDHLKSSILENISQKIKTPLNSIIGYVDLMEKSTNSSEENQAYCQLIVSQSKHLLQIFSDILQVSSLDSHVLKMKNETISLHNFLEEINKNYLKKLERKHEQNIRLICYQPPSSIEDIISDSKRIRQIFTILLDNAIKFISSGEVRFGYYSHDKDLLKCFVTYPFSGPDFDKDNIFDIFRQTGEASRINYGDSRFGFAVCKGNAHLLGGDIWLEADPKFGNTFYFTIKYTSQETNSSVILNQLIKDKHWRTNEILLVEDDLCTVEYLTQILTKAGLKIFVAHNGMETQRYFQLLPQIDMVLLDVSLPDVDGLELVKQMKIIRKDIPVIAQTALTISDGGQELLKAGCDAYITKPYKRDQVLSVINSFMTL